MRINSVMQPLAGAAFPIAAISALLVAVSLLHAADRDPTMWLPSDPLAGRIVFEQKHCIECHAISGEGGEIGPDLAEFYFDGSFLDLASTFWNHIPDMLVEFTSKGIQWPGFTSEETTNLISYLYYLRYLGTPGDVEAGRALLRSKGCLSCHRVGDEGDREVGPPLDELKRYASPIYMVQAIWNHGPKMGYKIEQLGLQRPEFNGQEISDMSAYIRTVSTWSTHEKIFLSPGDPNQGKLVFSRKRCDGCHSVHGVGGDSGPALDDADLNMSATGIAAVMWNHGAEMLSTMKEEGIGWPVFEGRELADLIAYLYFITFIDPPGDVERGMELFERKGCVSCHAIRGHGGEVGPDLSKKLIASSSNIVVLSKMINHAAKMSEKVLSKGKTWPTLDGQEMRDIFEYLRTEAESDQ